MTTQDEADRLADQVGIIDHGRLVAVGTANELKSRAGQDVLDVRLADSSDLDRAASLLGGEPAIDRADGRLTAPVKGGATEMLHRAGALTEAGIAIADVALRRPTLDDVFLSLTGRPSDDTDTDTLEESA